MVTARLLLYSAAGLLALLAPLAVSTAILNGSHPIERIVNVLRLAGGGR